MTIPRLIGAAVLVLSLGAVACDDDDDPLTPQAPTSFTADLRGGNERPQAVTTDAFGTATFTVNAARTEIAYSVKVQNFTNNVTACHIHSGKGDASSAVLVTLCPAGVTGPLTALTEIASGTIRPGVNSTTTGSSPISIATLIEMMAAGDVYVNVHSNANTTGEIRGTVTVVP
jgi:hypothetical protein